VSDHYGVVQIYVNGKPEGQALNVIAGDSVLFTMPGKLVNGRVAIAEEKATRLQEQVRSWGSRVASLEQTIREMVAASSHDEAVGIAFRSGALREDL
jgi:hypothetical protein